MSRNTDPLKALHVASGDLWAGAEVQLFTLLGQLKRNPELEVHAALLNEGELARRLRTQGVQVTVFDEASLGGMQIMLGLRRLMQEFAPDIVHTHRQKENVLGCLANMLATHSRSVRTCHGAPEHKPVGLANVHKHVFYTLDTWSGRFLQQKIIAVSAPLARDLAATFKPSSIVVIDNGIDIQAVQSAVAPVDFRLEAPQAMHIGIVGRLEQVKRVDLFIGMCAELLRQAPQTQWRFHVIGDGSLRQHLERVASTLNLGTALVFHGHRNDSAACLAALDALVMCSDHEGMPMTPLESIAVGTPVVAHDVGGLASIVSQGVGGILTKDHTPPGYAQAVLTLLASDLASVCAQGLARVAGTFSAQANAAKVASLYRSLLPK